MHTCRACRIPATRRAYWTAKLRGNAGRDRRVRRKIGRLGWTMLVVWECQTRDAERLRRRLEAFLYA
jgi:G:T-mismatch repair DNA endonuclease (very short patch repair protein)